MTFLYPYNALLLVMVGGLFGYVSWYKKRSVLTASIKEKLKVDAQGVRTFQSLKGMWLLIFFLLVVAMCRPVVVEQSKSDAYKMQTGLLAIALDISKSMLAHDVYPNRLEFSKMMLQEMFKTLDDFKVALSAFSKDVFIVSPFTSDKETVAFLLSNLDTNSMSSEGSSIRASLMGMEKIYASFQKEIKDVLIITDGADGLELKESIEEAKKNHMRVHICIIGTKEGSSMMDSSARVIKDSHGKVVITKRDDTLIKLAEETGGVYMITNGSLKELPWLLDTIKTNASKEESFMTKKQYTHELFYIPLGIALLLLWYVLFQPRWNRSLMHFLLLLGCGYPLHTEAEMLDFWQIIQAERLTVERKHDKALVYYQAIDALKKSDVSRYNLANSYYRNHDFEKAAQLYQEITTNNLDLEYERLHNLGNAFYKLGAFYEAIEAYQKALHVKEEQATRFNLEYVLERLENKMASEFDSESKNKESDSKEDKPKPSAASNANQEDEEKKEHDAQNSPSNKPPEDKDAEKWERTLRNQKPKTQPQPLIKNETLEKDNAIFW